MDIAAILTPDILLLAAGLLVAGVFAGIIAGLLGVGGGIVIVPVLFHAFPMLGVDEAVRMHLAVGTSLATIIPTSLRSVASHNKHGAVDWVLLKEWAVPITIGVLAGSAAANYVSGGFLMLVFAVIALAVALNLAFGKEEWRLGDAMPGGGAKHAIGMSIGGLSTLMGIGGGTFGVTLMTLFNVPIHRAVATAAGLGVIISIPGTIGFISAGIGELGRPPLSLGYVNLIGFALIVPATVLTTPWGVALAHALPRQTLKRAFAAFLALTSIRMFMDLI